MITDAQHKANLRMAWVLAALAAVFGLGFVVRIVFFGG
ncbi:MAG: cytochrome oxidase small assembly protein [Rubrivivax sp.]|nr:cytochrome oxidase small assembly protein [Rubrivivax sp.]